MHDTLRELAQALRQPWQESTTRCRCKALTGERCDWHEADYWGAPRCGWKSLDGEPVAPKVVDFRAYDAQAL